jgi:hypothetical protein
MSIVISSDTRVNMPNLADEGKWPYEGKWRVAENLISPEMSRGARGVLGWSIAVLADASGLSRNTVTRFELGGETTLKSILSIREAFTRAGVMFGSDEAGREHVVFEPASKRRAAATPQ